MNRSDMKCIESHIERRGVRRRKYRLPSGRHLVTLELPAAVVRGIGGARIAELMAAWQRGFDKAERRVRGLQLLAEGWKPAAIAHELGVSEAAVRQWRSARAAEKSLRIESIVHKWRSI